MDGGASILLALAWLAIVASCSSLFRRRKAPLLSRAEEDAVPSARDEILAARARHLAATRRQPAPRQSEDPADTSSSG